MKYLLYLGLGKGGGAVGTSPLLTTGHEFVVILMYDQVTYVILCGSLTVCVRACASSCVSNVQGQFFTVRVHVSAVTG